MRLGFFPKTLRQEITKEKSIWFHAVSVGEVIAVLGLIERIKKDFPQHQIVLSTVTKTGYSVAQARLPIEDVIIYAPIDFSWVVRKYIRLIKPEIYITAETEIWPNLFTALSKQHIPIAQVNGRISDKGYARYRMVCPLIKGILRKVESFCMQSQLDADRIVALGAFPDSVHVVGNIKFDDAPQKTGDELEDLGLRGDTSLWIAGSTHPGEEDIVLNIFKGLKEEFPNLHLVIASRHVERAGEVANLVKAHGFESRYLSQLLAAKEMSLREDSVVVVDQIGYLRSLYSLAEIVFVGKSLTVGGGQNIIEPAFFGKPILVGPQMQNFKDVVRIFLEAGGVIQVQDADELLTKMRELLKDPSKRQSLGHAAQKVVRDNQGATAKTQQLLSNLLTHRSESPQPN